MPRARNRSTCAKPEGALLADDDFFRVRALEAKFPFPENFADFAREVALTMDGLEQEDTSKFQIVIDTMFAMHRKQRFLDPASLLSMGW